MSGAGFYEMFVAPPWVTTSAQWAGWWLSSKLRGPVLDAHDLGLADNQSANADLLGPSGPRWSVRDLGEVTDEQVDRFAADVEQAVRAETGQGRTVELTVREGHSTLLAMVASQAGIQRPVLARIAGRWIITVTAEQVRMRPYPPPSFTGSVPAGGPTGADPEYPDRVYWPLPDHPAGQR